MAIMVNTAHRAAVIRKAQRVNQRRDAPLMTKGPRSGIPTAIMGRM